MEIKGERDSGECFLGVMPPSYWDLSFRLLHQLSKVSIFHFVTCLLCFDFASPQIAVVIVASAGRTTTSPWGHDRDIAEVFVFNLSSLSCLLFSSLHLETNSKKEFCMRKRSAEDC